MSRPSHLLEIRDLHAVIAGREIIKGVSLRIRGGEKHALMGPNGSGKSTLAYALMGHPECRITSGSVLLDGADITSLPADRRARAGLFLAFQYPVAIPGVTVAGMLRSAVKARFSSSPDEIPPQLRDFRKTLRERFEMLGIDWNFATRYINDGFSGGEKKRLEILQLAMLEPSIALLDEPDSGLDIDAVKVVAKGIETVAADGMGLLLITHYQRILNYVRPDFVHVLLNGRVVRSGGPELARELEETGYDPLEAGFGPAPKPREPGA